MTKLSQTDLAKRLGISSSLVSHWESGVRAPSEAQTMDLSRALGVSLDYLLNAEISPRFEFRALKTKSPRDQVQAVLRDASQQVFYLDSVFRMAGKPLKPFRLEAEFSEEQLPDIVTQFRDSMRLNRRVTLGELKEALAEWDVFVFEWQMPTDVSGISYRGATTVVIINERHTKERKLFTLAHEFAHILFHLGRGDQRRQTEVSLIASNRDPKEKQANQFASELLMPSAEVQRLLKEWTPSALRQRVGLGMAAQAFNVSVDAMFYRLAAQGVFRWEEKQKYIPRHIEPQESPAFRVIDLKKQISKSFLHTAVALHEKELVSAGKLAEWFFAPRSEVESYLADLSNEEENGIGDADEE